VPGLLGIVSRSPDADVAARFDVMRRHMRQGPRTTTETLLDPGGHWAIGRVHLGVLQPQRQLVEGERVQVLFHGDLQNAIALKATIRQKADVPLDTVPACLTALYREAGGGFAARLKGSFCAAVVDRERRELRLITDRLASYPLYWFHVPGRLTFGSELHAVLRDHPRPALDVGTVADIASLGFPFGERTFAAGVQLLPAASTLTYNWQTDAVRIERYASLADSFEERETSRHEYHERLGQAFDRAMEDAVAGIQRVGLSLSGGLDTRVILSALDRRQVPMTTFTIGGKGCADEVIAAQLSRMAKTDHQFIELGNEYLGDLVPNMRRMVSLTDGMYISHGFTETLALRAFEQSEFPVLLRGHAGELAKTSTAWPLHTDASINAMTSAEEFVPYMFGRLNRHYHGESLRGVFTGDAAAAAENGHARHTLERAVAGVSLAPADLSSYLYLHEYHRRVTVPSLEIFRHVVDVRLPLADTDFLDVVLQGRRAWREGTDIHRHLIGRSGGRFLGVRNPNTGARAGAGPLEEWAFDKVNSALRRLNVYGYRHYHSFDGWMRQSFLESVERVLLGPESRDRGLLHVPAVQSLLRDARQGAQRHDHVLQLLVNVELWQQLSF
jgi:asparagine synthase (glutamine-hydrolysing)